MYEVDARGLSCPEPVLLTAAALKAHGNTQVKVLVSETYARDNVAKLAKSKGKKVVISEKASEYELLID